jgi:hypothetical protein
VFPVLEALPALMAKTVSPDLPAVTAETATQALSAQQARAAFKAPQEWRETQAALACKVPLGDPSLGLRVLPVPQVARA